MRFRAIGRVHPERAALTFNTIKWGRPGREVLVSCTYSQIYAVIDHPGVDGADSAHHSIEHAAHSIVSAAGFLKGCSYATEIIQLIDDQDQSYIFGVQHPEVAYDVPQEILNQRFEELTILIQKDIFLRFAIGDYTNAITDYTGGAMLCFRALESLAKSIGKTGVADTKWEPMHKALGTSKKLIQDKIGCFAKPERHGNWAEVRTNSDQRTIMLTYTRDVISKYIEYALDLNKHQ